MCRMLKFSGFSRDQSALPLDMREAACGGGRSLSEQLPDFSACKKAEKPCIHKSTFPGGISHCHFDGAICQKMWQGQSACAIACRPGACGTAASEAAGAETAD